jgi:hypothetical protein
VNRSNSRELIKSASVSPAGKNFVDWFSVFEAESVDVGIIKHRNRSHCLVFHTFVVDPGCDLSVAQYWFTLNSRYARLDPPQIFTRVVLAKLS